MFVLEQLVQRHYNTYRQTSTHLYSTHLHIHAQHKPLYTHADLYSLFRNITSPKKGYSTLAI